MIDLHEVVEKLFQQLVVSHGKRLDAVSLTEGKFIHNWGQRPSFKRNP
jgi:hypothetical protein